MNSSKRVIGKIEFVQVKRKLRRIMGKICKSLRRDWGWEKPAKMGSQTNFLPLNGKNAFAKKE